MPQFSFLNLHKKKRENALQFIFKSPVISKDKQLQTQKPEWCTHVVSQELPQDDPTGDQELTTFTSSWTLSTSPWGRNSCSHLRRRR